MRQHYLTTLFNEVQPIPCLDPWAMESKSTINDMQTSCTQNSQVQNGKTEYTQ